MHTIAVANGGDDPDLLISGSIAGSTGIRKTGAGTLQFAAAAGNSYTGTTELQAGTLVLFESWLRHAVPPNPAASPRISISFNYNWF